MCLYSLRQSLFNGEDTQIHHGTPKSQGEKDTSGLTQELKSAIKYWWYAQHQHDNTPCHGKVSYWFTVAHHTNEWWELSPPVRPRVARYSAARPLSAEALVPTTLGILCPEFCDKGRLFGDG